MTSTLINQINTSLGVGSSASSSSSYTAIDSCYTAIRVWAYVNQNMNVQIVYADSSSGDSSLAETYPVYRNNTSVINSIKKKSYAKTIVNNPSDGAAATRVLVKTFHATRDPNPVLTYNTDDVTLQANFDMDTFELSLANLQTDVSLSSIQVYGSVATSDVGNYRILLTDTCGRSIVTTDSNYPLNITASAETSNMVVYGTTTAGNKVSVAVSACGELLTNIQDTALTGPTSLYATATHVAADSSTSVIDIGTFSRQVNIMGQSSQLCSLKVQTSPDGTSYYDSIYTVLVKTVDTNFVQNVPSTERYIVLVPDADTSLTLKYTY